MNHSVQDWMERSTIVWMLKHKDKVVPLLSLSFKMLKDWWGNRSSLIWMLRSIPAIMFCVMFLHVILLTFSIRTVYAEVLTVCMVAIFLLRLAKEFKFCFFYKCMVAYVGAMYGFIYLQRCDMLGGTTDVLHIIMSAIGLLMMIRLIHKL